MPMAIPAYIPDVDALTAARLELRIIRRRKAMALLRSAAAVLLAAALAFAARESAAGVEAPRGHRTAAVAE